MSASTPYRECKVYPNFDHIEDETEKKALEALYHEDGEEFPGQFDGYRSYLEKRGYDNRSLEGKLRRTGEGEMEKPSTDTYTKVEQRRVQLTDRHILSAVELLCQNYSKELFDGKAPFGRPKQMRDVGGGYYEFLWEYV